MARTPLLRQLLGAYHVSREAALARVPSLEYAEMRRDRLSRRRFLQASGAAVGATMVAGCASTPRKHAQQSIPKARVIVVGAGIGGLHCAYQLAQLGLRADVFDAAARPGGRMHTDRDTFPQGMSCELGGELIDTGHETMRDLATEFHLPLYDYREDAPVRHELVAQFGGRQLSEAEILEGFAPIAERVDAALAELRDPEAGVSFKAPNGAEALDQQSIRQWLDEAKASGPVRELLEVAYLTEYGLETDDSNALNFLMMISTERAKLEIFGESDERFRVSTGSDSVTTKLAESLEPGQLHFGQRLVKLHAGADGRLVCTFTHDKLTVEETADHVVCAIPFTLLREVEIAMELPAVKRRAIRELGYGASTKLMCGFRSRVWRAQGSNGEVFTDLPFQCTWDTSRMQSGDAGILTNFSGGRHALAVGESTREYQRDIFLDALDQVFQGAKTASNGRVLRMHWPSYPLTKGAYSSYRVGQYTAFSGEEITRVGNLHFCGEHTSVDAQGFMEGGALTGAMAASEIAEDLGLEVKTSSFGGPRERILARAKVARAGGSWIAALRRARRSQLVASR